MSELDQKGSKSSTGVKPGTKGFAKGVSGNPRGRPRGSRNKTTVMAQALFDENGEAIVAKVIELALEKGDRAALKICVDRLVPPRKSYPVNIRLPEIRSASDIVESYSALLTAVSKGEISPEEARTIADILDSARRAVETADHEERLTRIEAALEAKP